jgi:alkylation response protein AidB-like acyl-CoA dehydrogenase
MEFEFNEDQHALANLAQTVFTGHCSDARIRQVYESGDAFDPELWKSLAETGLLSAILPTKAGGSGLGMIEFGLLLEAQGAAVAPVPLWRHQLAALAILNFGTEALKQATMSGLVDGTMFASVWTDAGETPSLQAVASGDGWVLDGLAECVVIDDRTELLLLPVRRDDGSYALVAAPVDLPGVAIATGLGTNYEPLVDIQFTGVKLEAAALLSCAEAYEWLEVRSCLAVAALQLGITAEALRRGAEYLGTREQFGRPIGSFQGVAIRMAEAYIQLELLRTAQWQLAWQIDQELPAMHAAHLAKFQASEAGHIIGHTVQHYHGGIGADLTYPIHRYFLWCTALDLSGGGAEKQLQALGSYGLPETVGFETCLKK